MTGWLSHRLPLMPNKSWVAPLICSAAWPVAAAWALCDCVALAPERALPLIGEDPPPPVIRRMLLQKARDSKRVPPDVLARLQSLPAAREETGGKEAKDFGKTV